jgi:methylthioribose-1-phosphate isomerase
MEEFQKQTLKAIKYENNELYLLNQLILPFKFEYEKMESLEDTYNAIKLMKVRGGKNKNKK